MYQFKLIEALELPPSWDISAKEIDECMCMVLSPREKLFLELEYRDGLTVLDISVQHNITVSKACYVRGKALRRLRDFMWETFEYRPIDPTIDILHLPARQYNSLMRAGYSTIAKLLKIRSEEHLLDLKGIGKEGARKIIDSVHCHGYFFEYERERWMMLDAS